MVSIRSGPACRALDPACVAIGHGDGVTALEEGLLPGASAASAWATNRTAETPDRELESTRRSLGRAPLRS